MSLAKRIAERIFTNGAGQKARRLVFELDHELKGMGAGGWSQEPIEGFIARELEAAGGGLSRRDQIAALALQGLLANPEALRPPVFFNPSSLLPEEPPAPGRILIGDPSEIKIVEVNLAALAVRHADALIEKLDGSVETIDVDA